jgi:hypothetical protein
VDFSEAYPNPASAFTSFNYSFPSGLKDVKLTVRNIIGSKVGEYPINNLQGKLVISTTNLKQGIYIYSLTTDNQTLLTQKFIVNR